MAYSFCGTSVGNTGSIGCDVALGSPEAIHVWNGSKAISSITGTAFQEFLETSSKLSKNDSDKVFVFPDIQDVADNTEENTTASLNKGFTTVIKEGKPSYTFKVFASKAQAKELRKFNGTHRVLILDNNNREWGVKSGNNYRGFTANIFVTGHRFDTQQGVEYRVITITVSLQSARELNDDAIYGEVESASGIIGLIDVPLVETAAKASNVYHVTGRIPTAEIGEGYNIYEKYSSQLASAGLWVAKTGSTFSTTLPITSVAADPTNSGWTVTFDTTAFAALPALAKIHLNLAAPSVLTAADVTETEGVYIELTK